MKLLVTPFTNRPRLYKRLNLKAENETPSKETFHSSDLFLHELTGGFFPFKHHFI